MIDKPNEFEHGLMLGMLMMPKNNKSGDIDINNAAIENTLSDGSKIKTWAEKTVDNYTESSDLYREAYSLFQERTYPDGTIEKVTVASNFTNKYNGVVTTLILKGEWVGWELCSYNNLTEYNRWYWYIYTLRTNTITRYRSKVDLHWNIPI